VDINNLRGAQRSWINERLGLHARQRPDRRARRPGRRRGPAAVRGADDEDGPFQLDQSRIYFGELSPSYSIVNTERPRSTAR
jgi:hypothetical protein